MVSTGEWKDLQWKDVLEFPADRKTKNIELVYIKNSYLGRDWTSSSTAPVGGICTEFALQSWLMCLRRLPVRTLQPRLADGSPEKELTLQFKPKAVTCTTPACQEQAFLLPMPSVGGTRPTHSR